MKKSQSTKDKSASELIDARVEELVANEKGASQPQWGERGTEGLKVRQRKAATS